MPSQPGLLAEHHHINISVPPFVLLLKKGRHHRNATTQSFPIKFSSSYFPIFSISHFSISLYQSFVNLLWPACCHLKGLQQVDSLNHSLVTWVVLNPRFWERGDKRGCNEQRSSHLTVFSQCQQTGFAQDPLHPRSFTPNTVCPEENKINILAPLLERTALER